MIATPGCGRALRRLLAATACLLALLAAPATAQAEVIRLHRVEWNYIAPDPAAATDDGAAPGTSFPLPLRWSSEEKSSLRHVGLRLHFRLASVPTEAIALLFGHASEGGRYLVNGHPVGAIAAESADRHVDWHRPALFTLDPSVLVEGENEITVTTSFGPGPHQLADVEVGPSAEVWNDYAVGLFLDYAWNWCGATLALLSTFFFGTLWLQRHEKHTHLLALAGVCWLAYAATWIAEIMPAGLRPWVSGAGTLALAAFCATLSIALLRLCEISRKREEWLIWAYALLGPVVSVATGMQADPYLRVSWQPGLTLIVAIATGIGFYRRTRTESAPHVVILLGALAFVLAAASDFGTVVGLNRMAGSPAINLAGPLMLLALTTPLVEGFILLMRETESAKAELESRVREREQLLKRNYERLRESERGKVEIQERQRIMQDMHDGLGSQLLSSLMLVERGAVSNEQFAQILRESIDDMRLAIDALAAEQTDLAAALGNLRFRMEPRLRAAGMELTWDARRLPEEVGLHPDVVLPILRIVQEALTNALKHSQARAVRVVLAVENGAEGQLLDIRIADNGRGITEERTGGRGLLNMRSRAQKIGAQLRVESVPGSGTTVHLRAKVMAPDKAAHKDLTQLNTEAVLERVRL